MYTKEKKKVCVGGRFFGRTNPQAPNQALQRMNVLVTDCAPSSTLRAKHVHRWALTFGNASELFSIIKKSFESLWLFLRLFSEFPFEANVLLRENFTESRFTRLRHMKKKQIKNKDYRIEKCFINGKLKRWKVPLVEGLPVDEFIRRNACDIYLSQEGHWDIIFERQNRNNNPDLIGEWITTRKWKPQSRTRRYSERPCLSRIMLLSLIHIWRCRRRLRCRSRWSPYH